jgi:hypothetical protein
MLTLLLLLALPAHADDLRTFNTMDMRISPEKSARSSNNAKSSKTAPPSQPPS